MLEKMSGKLSGYQRMRGRTSSMQRPFFPNTVDAQGLEESLGKEKEPAALSDLEVGGRRGSKWLIFKKWHL